MDRAHVAPRTRHDRLVIALVAVVGGPLATAFGSFLLISTAPLLHRQEFSMAAFLGLFGGSEPLWFRRLMLWGILLTPASLAAAVFAGVWASRFLARRKQRLSRGRFYLEGARWGLLYGLGCLACVLAFPPVILIVLGDPAFGLVSGLSAAAGGALSGWIGAMVLGRSLESGS